MKRKETNTIFVDKAFAVALTTGCLHCHSLSFSGAAMGELHIRRQKTALKALHLKHRIMLLVIYLITLTLLFFIVCFRLTLGVINTISHSF